MKATMIPPTPASPTYVMELSEPEMLSVRQVLRNLSRANNGPLFRVLDKIEDQMQEAGWPRGTRPNPDYTIDLLNNDVPTRA